ncbi:MAG: hypothetical protein ACP5O7_12910, partial [Phycisphaerae bacterium]
MKNKVCSVMNSNVKAYFTNGQRGTIAMLARLLIFACVLVLCQACFAQASGNLPKLTPAQMAAAKVNAAKFQTAWKGVQHKLARMENAIARKFKSMTPKDIKAFGIKYKRRYARYLVMMDQMMAMSSGHWPHPEKGILPPDSAVVKIAQQDATVKWHMLRLVETASLSPPATVKEKADFKQRYAALHAKDLLLGGAITTLQQARFNPAIGKKQKHSLLTGAAKLVAKAAAVPGKIDKAAADAALNAMADLLIQTTENNGGHARVKGEVVDPSGKLLNGVKMVVEKSDMRGLGVPDKVSRYAKTINGHFDISASGFNLLNLKFYKDPWRQVQLWIGANKGFSASIVSNNAAINAPYKRKGHTWTVRVVLPAKPPQVTLINYPGQVSEDATGHGDAITLSTADRMKS